MPTVRSSVTNLGLWNLVVLPMFGLLSGLLIRIILSSYPRMIMLIIHIVTMSFMIIVINDTMTPNGATREMKHEEKLVYIAIGYLFLLGFMFGIVS